MSTGNENIPTVNTHEYRGYRQIWLVNANNEMFDLAGDPNVCKVFLNGPRGLGFDTELSSIRFGNANYTVTSQAKFPSISGTLIFYKEPYETYREFISFLNAGDIKLYYQPKDHEYYMDVDVTKVDKTEIDKYGALRCSISFTPLSFWKDRTVTIKRNIKANGYIDLSQINTDLDVGFELTLTDAAMTDPECTLILTNQNGSYSYEYGKAKFNGVYSIVNVNSNDGSHFISLKDTNNTLIFGEKASAMQDFSLMNGSKYITFMKIPKKFKNVTNIMLQVSVACSVTVVCTPILRSI